MGLKNWLRILAALVGAAALSALIWFAGPLVAISDTRPLESSLIRLGLVAAVVLVIGGVTAWQVWRHVKAARALEKSLAEAEETSSDAGVLQEGMRDALATLKKSRGQKADFLYELPWYMIIGPPGAGKTTALVNSGLKFPLARGASPEAVAGIGGTRYCDWWFTEDAVLIDTAGRYTTQDSDEKGDRASWLAFLDLLARNRPRQPINGVIIAISLEDLLTGTDEEITAHATAIRKRLLELHDRLKVDFPVYAVFTKADLLSGFTEFFGHLPEAERRMVWGHTFQTADKTKNMIGEVPAEFDALVERLNEWLPDRLQDEPTPTSRVVMFGFPSQVASAKKHVVDFLNRVFEPSRYHVNATLRGFYFSSGTQQGTPIDQLIGALSRSFGSQDVEAAAYSGRGKSYFLNDLLKKVVIGEAGWVSTNRAAVRRTNVIRLATYGSLAVLSAVLVGLWWTSYLRNAQLISVSNTLLNKYRGEATDVLREPVVADRNFSRVLPLLNTLRFMPNGYASREEAVPVMATFGLSQHARLKSAEETTYHQGLERLLRPRLIFRLEEQIEANRNSPSFIYEALKVYLMVGGRAEVPIDRGLVLTWMRRDWAENLFPGAGFARGRELLEDHLQAMLDLDDGTPPLVTVNQALVEESQKTLARLSIAERAYELLKSQARVATARDWVATKAGGPDARLVFEATGGADLDTVRVPFFFTYDGFFEGFIDRFGDVADAAERDRWVLGEFGKQQGYTQQYGSLFADLLKLYAREFTPAWNAALNRLKIRPLSTDKPRYIALQAIAAPTSPLKQIIESLRDETRLTKERSQVKKNDGAPTNVDRAKAAAIEDTRKTAISRVQSAVPQNLAGAASALLGAGAPAQQPAGDRFQMPSNEAPGANIEANFRQFHILVDGEPGRRTLDTLVQSLNEVKNAALDATNPTEALQANNRLVTQARVLRAVAARFPAPFEPMIRQVAAEFEGNVTNDVVREIQQAYANTVVRDCQEIVSNKYPFSKASEREVALADFGRLFGPASGTSGILDKFFQQYLASRVDQSRTPWAFKQDDQVSRALSASALREFQRADEIRKTFFASGGTIPNINFAVTPLTLTGDAVRAKLEVNGGSVLTQQGVNTPTGLLWPGAGAGTVISIEGETGFFGGKGPSTRLMERTGVWSLFRVIDSGSVLRQGDAVVATFVAGGRELSYRFSSNTSQNPLVLPALREFKCPSGL